MTTTNFKDHLTRVAKILQRRAMQYMVVGGTAVAFHGYVRPITDRDGNF